MSLKILLLEDDMLFNETLQDFLEEEGFVVTCFLDPYSVLDATYEERYDLYLFDVNLPYESGFELLKKLRESGDMTPTIFLTSRDDSASLQEGFALGGDDYMKKPIDLDELLCRIGALLRRQSRQSRMVLGEYLLDRLEKRLYGKENTPLEITQKAVELLILLVEAQGEVLSAEVIKSHLWAAGQQASDGALRVYITQLKKYFPKQIENIRGIGYKWVL
jgi:DNA-binding response OmpR family regulator